MLKFLGANGINLGWVVRLLVSAIFVISVFGKTLDIGASSLSLKQLFGLPKTISQITVIFWSLVEAALAIFIWHRKMCRTFLVVPIMLVCLTFYSSWRGIDCGCFGSLPFLSHMPLTAHLLLLVGMFLGLYYLSAPSKIQQDETTGPWNTLASNKSPAPQWISLAAVILMASAFLTLPFSSSTGHALDSGSKDFIELADVETAIANRSAILIDARPEFQYELGHIPGAVNIPYDAENLAEIISNFSLQDYPLIVYCTSPHCNAAELLAEKLLAHGYKNVRVFAGGWEEWVNSREGEGVRGRVGEKD